MDNSVRQRIDSLKKLNNIESDNDLIIEIYKYKKKYTKNIKNDLSDYVSKNKGSFSKMFNGTREFRPEDYLAIEFALNTSMAYIIDGKGEVPNSFIPSGIRYAAFTDTIGNYKDLSENLLNSSDEYNKTLLDYMIQYKSKNGFEYFAKLDLLPIAKNHENTYKPNQLVCYGIEKPTILKTMCELLSVDLLIPYFTCFVHTLDIYTFEHNSFQNPDFTDEVISEAIKREDLRKEIFKTKIIDLNEFNKHLVRINSKPLGKGLFVNYIVTIMIKYALTHKIDSSVREELLENSIKLNKDSLNHAAAFEVDELKIDKYGYITDKHEFACYGSIVVTPEPTIELSRNEEELLKQLNNTIHCYHKYISSQSKIISYNNEIIVEKKDNPEYYSFYKLMNDSKLKTVPVYLKEQDGKDYFEVKNSNNSRLINGTDEAVFAIIEAIKEIDELSTRELNGKTYFVVDPSIYVCNGAINYIIPKDVVVSNRYSNFVWAINVNAMWYLNQHDPRRRINGFIHLLKLYGIKKEELNDFLNQFIEITNKQFNDIDRTSERGKEIAMKMMENKSFVDIYRENIIKAF